jgi:hypothetical protein
VADNSEGHRGTRQHNKLFLTMSNVMVA